MFCHSTAFTRSFHVSLTLAEGLTLELYNEQQNISISDQALTCRIAHRLTNQGKGWALFSALNVIPRETCTSQVRSGTI
jgi:hypothetical protein